LQVITTSLLRIMARADGAVKAAAAITETIETASPTLLMRLSSTMLR
jgi:hypothetical protein